MIFVLCSCSYVGIETFMDKLIFLSGYSDKILPSSLIWMEEGSVQGINWSYSNFCGVPLLLCGQSLSCYELESSLSMIILP